jgi:hybrid polyketide synthase / nonribosomal peptide synthetase ACE1
MSSLAAQRRKRGRAASVIDIGMVIGVGYLTRVDRSIENQLRKLGYMAISEQEIRTIFAEAIYTGVPGSSYPSEIITGLQSLIDAAKPAWHDSPKFSHHQLVASLHEERSTPEVAVSIKAQLASSHGLKEIKEMLEVAFVTQLQVILQLAPGFVTVDRSLLELGIDSLMAVEIRSWFLKELDYNFPVLKILGGASAAECEFRRPCGREFTDK